MSILLPSASPPYRESTPSNAPPPPLAPKMAQAEASIIASRNLAQVHAQQPDNIQSADVILKVLNDHENILVTKWVDNSPTPTDKLLVARGKRRTALLKDRQDYWSEYHRRSRFLIHSITDVLTHKIKQGLHTLWITGTSTTRKNEHERRRLLQKAATFLSHTMLSSVLPSAKPNAGNCKHTTPSVRCDFYVCILMHAFGC